MLHRNPPHPGLVLQKNQSHLTFFPELGYGYATGNCFRVCFNLKVHIASKTSFKLFKHTKLQYGVSCLLLKVHIQTSFQIDRFLGYLQLYATRVHTVFHVQDSQCYFGLDNMHIARFARLVITTQRLYAWSQINGVEGPVAFHP